MNQTYNSTLILIVVIGIVMVLFFVALLMRSGKKDNDVALSSTKTPRLKRLNISRSIKAQNSSGFRFESPKGVFKSSDDLLLDEPASSHSMSSKHDGLLVQQDETHCQLLQLKAMIDREFQDLNSLTRAHHVLLQRKGIAIAMLTIDKSQDIGRRRLGKVEVINFHELPTIDELRIELMGL